jgi:integrase
MVCDVVSDYAAFRDQRLPVVRNSFFFLLDNGQPFQYQQALYAFHCIRSQLGWDTCLSDFRPRLYDLRHTFVCKRLLAWYKEGGNIDQMLPLLSTYLGHAKVSDTYWYLTGIPELMAIAAERFEQQSYITPMRGAV